MGPSINEDRERQDPRMARTESDKIKEQQEDRSGMLKTSQGNVRRRLENMMLDAESAREATTES